MNEQGFVSLTESGTQADSRANASCVCYDCVSCDCDCDSSECDSSPD